MLSRESTVSPQVSAPNAGAFRHGPSTQNLAVFVSTTWRTIYGPYISRWTPRSGPLSRLSFFQVLYFGALCTICISLCFSILLTTVYTHKSGFKIFGHTIIQPMKTSASRRSPRSQSSQSPRHSGGRGRAATSLAVGEREKSLLADPSCIIVNPHLTMCKVCKAEIKLSPKMMFDTCHWFAHRDRCVRSRSGRDSCREMTQRDHTAGGEESESGSSAPSSPSTSTDCPESLEAAYLLLSLRSGRSQKN